MTANEWLKAAEKQLTISGIGTARLDALVLLEHVTKKNRAWLLANPDYNIPDKQQAVLNNVLNRRGGHEPLAYIRGHTEFYGRKFLLTTAVLEPRPESETMIDLLKKLPDMPDKPRIADIGAGSGAIGITAMLELPGTEIDLIEVAAEALEVAILNVDKFTLGIKVIKSDLLAQTDEQYDILLCNLPYVPDNYHINEAANREPRIAIFGGQDGLDVYRRLFQQVKNLAWKPLYILTESLPPQHSTLRAIARRYDYNLHDENDFIQVFSQKLKL